MEHCIIPVIIAVSNMRVRTIYEHAHAQKLVSCSVNNNTFGCSMIKLML